MSNKDLEFLATLEAVIADRIATADGSSYTASLAASGRQRVAQKVGEEAVELALASVAGSREDVTDEAADLVYHLLVLLRVQDLDLAAIAARLRERHAGSA